MSRREYIRLSQKLLLTLLSDYFDLPADACIVGVRHDPFLDTVDILLQSHSFLEAVEGGLFPQMEKKGRMV